MQALAEIKMRIKDRIQIVEEGYEYCKKNDCKEGSAGYENWSTPSRDKRVLTLYADLANTILQLSNQPEYFVGAMASWKEEVNNPLISLFGNAYSLLQIMNSWGVDGFNVQPWETVEKRWGLTALGFLQNASENLNNFLNLRNIKITDKKNSCLNTTLCAENSETWLKWNTYEIDQKIIPLALRLKMYCQLQPSVNCKEWEAMLAAQNIQSKSLLYWIKVAPWLNSDPRADLNIAWGENKFNTKHIEIDLNGQYTMDEKNNYLLINSYVDVPGGTKPTLYSLANFKSIESLSGYIWGGIQEKTSLLYSYKVENSKLDILFKSTDLTDVYAFTAVRDAESPLLMHWTNSDGVFVIIQGPVFTVVDVNKKTTSSYEFIADVLSKYIYLAKRINSKENEYSLFDLSGSSAVEATINLPLSDIKNKKLFLLDTTHKDDDKLIVAVQLCEKNFTNRLCEVSTKGTYFYTIGGDVNPIQWYSNKDAYKTQREIIAFFDKTKYALTRLSDDGFLYNYEFSKVISSGKLEFIKVVAKGTAHHLAGYSNDYFSILNFSDVAARIFYFRYLNNGKLSEFATAADEQLYDCYFDLCISTINSVQKVKNMTTAEVLYQSTFNPQFSILKTAYLPVTYMSMYSEKFPQMFKLDIKFNNTNEYILSKLPQITNSAEAYGGNYDYPYPTQVKNIIYPFRKGPSFNKGVVIESFRPTEILATDYLNQANNSKYLLLGD